MSEGKRTFLIWDAHSEYRDLLRLFAPEELIWLTPDELGINPFEVPLGKEGRRVMPPEKWLNNLREWFRLTYLNEPSLNLLVELVLAEYELRGLLENHDE